MKSEKPINFLGAVDKSTGIVGDRGHDLYGHSLRGVILAFPAGAGSSVGAYTIYSLKANDSAPLAMICSAADQTVASGCAVAGIPLLVVDGATFAALRTGQRMLIDTGAPGSNRGGRPDGEGAASPHGRRG